MTQWKSLTWWTCWSRPRSSAEQVQIGSPSTDTVSAIGSTGGAERNGSDNETSLVLAGAYFGAIDAMMLHWATTGATTPVT